MQFKIGELAKTSGIAAHTIRFYESKGLLPNPTRGSNGYRYYDEEAPRRLSLIQFGQRLGFTLEEILTILNAGGSWDHELVLGRLDARLSDIDVLEKKLKEQKQEIIGLKENLLTAPGECSNSDQLSKIICTEDGTEPKFGLIQK